MKRDINPGSSHSIAKINKVLGSLGRKCKCFHGSYCNGIKYTILHLKIHRSNCNSLAIMAESKAPADATSSTVNGRVVGPSTRPLPVGMYIILHHWVRNKPLL